MSCCSRVIPRNFASFWIVIISLFSVSLGCKLGVPGLRTVTIKANFQVLGIVPEVQI